MNPATASATLPALLSQKAALQSSSNAWDIIVLAFAGIVAIGIVGEVIGSVATAIKHLRLQAMEKSIDSERDRESLAETQRVALIISEANQRAKEADERAAIANLRVAQLEKDAADQRLFSGRSRSAWSKITISQASEINSACGPQTVDIVFFANDRESWEFANSVFFLCDNMLKWPARMWVLAPEATVIIRPGYNVMVLRDCEDRVRNAAGSLVNVINAGQYESARVMPLQLPPRLMFFSFTDPTPPNARLMEPPHDFRKPATYPDSNATIRITIGPKPGWQQ